MMAMMLLVCLIVFEQRVDRQVAFVASVTAAATFAADYVLCRTRRVRFAPSAVRRPSSR